MEEVIIEKKTEQIFSHQSEPPHPQKRTPVQNIHDFGTADR